MEAVAVFCGLMEAVEVTSEAWRGFNSAEDVKESPQGSASWSWRARRATTGLGLGVTKTAGD